NLAKAASSVLLNVQASLAVRSAVQTLISDTERRQNLIHNLITANEQLKQDVQLQQSRAARQEQKASELQQILDGVRTKIRDLEDDFINKTRRQRNEMRSAMREKQAALVSKMNSCHVAPKSCWVLYDLRLGRAEPLSVLKGTQEWLRRCTHGSWGPHTHYSMIFQSYQEQMKERREKHEQLMRENSQIRAELATRDKIFCCSFRGTNREQSEEQTASTAAQSLERLPASECRRYLQEACAQLHVLFILSEIRSVLGGPRAPQLLYKHSIRPQEPRNADSEDEAAFLHLLPTIELWAGQLVSLKTLHRALRKLNEKLLPNLEETCESGDVPRVEELLLLVDTMLEDVDTRAQDPACVSAHTLRALVAHFQKLFDVPSVSGVYPRMNEVYSKLGETCNMMRNLQCVLGLDGKVTCGALVNAVWQLCRELEEGESQKLRGVLGTLDIDSVINKIQEHEEFFPAFEGLITELLDVLGKYRALGARSCRAAQLPVRLSFINLVLSLQKSGGWSRSCRQCGG
uniref:Centrosomal protein of 70 kDa n=1 Tax=Leptobrachium leishanense TaxID=445787 RepID=A0A8C5PWH5_9ANUR